MQEVYDEIKSKITLDNKEAYDEFMHQHAEYDNKQGSDRVQQYLAQSGFWTKRGFTADTPNTQGVPGPYQYFPESWRRPILRNTCTRNDRDSNVMRSSIQYFRLHDTSRSGKHDRKGSQSRIWSIQGFYRSTCQKKQAILFFKNCNRNGGNGTYITLVLRTTLT